MRSVGLAGALSLLLLLLLSPVQAEPLAQPSGPVVLTVSGSIAETNRGDAAVFDADMLRALGVTEISTRTIWTVGVIRFEGVLLSTLLARVGARGSMLQATALNDYAEMIPMADATEDGPILALAMNGKPMTVRDKGPLWMIYPYDSNPYYQSEIHYSRSVWQLDRLIVLE